MEKLTRDEVLDAIGDPAKVAKELAEFSERMKREDYDPMADKVLIMTPVN